MIKEAIFRNGHDKLRGKCKHFMGLRNYGIIVIKNSRNRKGCAINVNYEIVVTFKNKELQPIGN